MRNINLDNEGRNAKQRRLENVRDNMTINRENENEEERLARLALQRELQSQIRENENEEERLARLVYNVNCKIKCVKMKMKKND